MLRSLYMSIFCLLVLLTVLRTVNASLSSQQLVKTSSGAGCALEHHCNDVLSSVLNHMQSALKNLTSVQKKN